MTILIIGAGPCGLGAAYRLNEIRHPDWQLVEKNCHVGGLSASFLDDAGFTWDIGGHVLFSHYDYFDRVADKALEGAWYEHQRESWVRILQTWAPYPFQNNVRYLPDAALQECLKGLRNLSGSPADATNFRDWLETVFGRGIVKYFMEPYNLKVWGVPLELMSKDWIAERVSVVDLARIELTITEQRDDLNWGPNNRFKFPRQGGTGAIFDGIAGPFRERIQFDKEMVSVDLHRKEVTFSDGERIRYDVLINTTPLDAFVRSCTPASEDLLTAADDLIHNSGLIVGIGVADSRVDPKCWMYFPEDNSPFYRVTNFHNYSPYNVPDGRTDAFFSLMCETTYSDYRTINKDTIIEETIAGLISSGLLEEPDRNRIISTWLIDIPYSYPVPTLGRDRALGTIQPYLESRDVYSRGRFGAWKYEVGNMDHSFMQGVEVVDRILSGIVETIV